MPARDTVDILGSADGTESYALRDFLTRIDQPYSWLEPESGEGRALLGAHGREGSARTVVVLDGATVLESPSLEVLAEALVIRYSPKRREYDLIVIGRPPLTLESSIPGFFVAGDVRHGSTKRVSAAVGEGAMAVSLVHRYLEERRAA